MNEIFLFQRNIENIITYILFSVKHVYFEVHA